MKRKRKMEMRKKNQQFGLILGQKWWSIWCISLFVWPRDLRTDARTCKGSLGAGNAGKDEDVEETEPEPVLNRVFRDLPVMIVSYVCCL
jgi:hypothetical protein